MIELTIRWLNFVQFFKAVAAALYDEGAVMVIHAVLIDCRLMLERSSNNYGPYKLLLYTYYCLSELCLYWQLDAPLPEINSC